VLTDSVAGARTRATVFSLNPMRPLLKSWEFSTLFCLNQAINQGNDSNMKSNDISDKDAIGSGGVEGRISYLKRAFGFQRCLYWGKLGFERWVGWGVIAHNLTIISRTLVQRTQFRFKPN
jgi:hypothetical protein